MIRASWAPLTAPPARRENSREPIIEESFVEEEEPKSGFRVKDSRRFSADGNERVPGDEAAPKAPEPNAPLPPEKEVRGEGFTARDAAEDGMPEMNFSTFVLSLHASAAMHMGLVADPQTGKPLPVQLPLAQQTIDILSMMEAKTRGNLDQDEERLLGAVLYELRMLFLEQRKKHG